MIQFHLSFDVKDSDSEYDREDILAFLLHETPILKINSFNESTLILYYPDTYTFQQLYKIFSENLDDYFYYSISQVSKTSIKYKTISRSVYRIKHNPNAEQDRHLQDDWERLKRKYKL